MTTAPVFVWVSGLRGPSPQIWHQGHMTQDGKRVPTLFRRELAGDEAGLSLDELARRYPAPPETITE